MSKTWKWILGITLGLVLLVAVGFAAASFFGFGHMSFWGGPAYSGHPMMDNYGFGDRAPRGGYQNFRHPMMGGRGFYPFGGFFFLGGLLRLIFPLAVLAAVGYFAYQKGKKDGAAEAAAPPSRVAPPEDES
jgi:hypothetical protein